MTYPGFCHRFLWETIIVRDSFFLEECLPKSMSWYLLSISELVSGENYEGSNFWWSISVLCSSPAAGENCISPKEEKKMVLSSGQWELEIGSLQESSREVRLVNCLDGPHVFCRILYLKKLPWDFAGEKRGEPAISSITGDQSQLMTLLGFYEANK